MNYQGFWKWLSGCCCVFLLWAVPVSAYAQKKEIATAREFVKKVNKLDKAEQMMRKLLQDSVNRRDERIWATLFDALRKQYEQGNEKLYLKQKYDTAQLFTVASKLFTDMATYDSIEAIPDSKGRIRFVRRKGNAELLNTLRPNLYHGGIFFIRKQKFPEAYQLLNQYVESANQPLFGGYRYGETDRRLPEAAYWAVYCAYKQGDVRKVLHHTYMALKDTLHREPMLQYLAETYQLDGDTARYVEILHEGFAKYPLSPYFYPHLIDYFSQNKDWAEALALTDKGLAVDSTSIVFELTKSTILLNMGQYDQSFALSVSLLHRCDSLAGAWLNAGLAKFNQAVALDKATLQTSRRWESIYKLYREALPYLERYRKDRPLEKEKWGLPLYTIYLNLNMGERFDEIDKLMKNNTFKSQ